MYGLAGAKYIARTLESEKERKEQKVKPKGYEAITKKISQLL